MEFSERLKSARLKAGMTQQEVADAVGVTKAAVCTWEGGTARPRMSKMEELAAALGMSVTELLGEQAVSDLPWDELELLRCYRLLAPQARLKLLTEARQLAPESGGGGANSKVRRRPNRPAPLQARACPKGGRGPG